jgi:hypothetical protein
VTVYLVQKLHWEYNDNWFEREGDEPVKAFESRDDALLWAELLEDEARRELEKGEGVGFSANPLRVFGGTERATSLTYDALWEKLDEAALLYPPPNDDLYEQAWWRALWPRITPVQRDWLWSLLDGVRFYEVIETELEEEAI